MAPFISALVSNGLSLLANAALVKGKEYVKEKTGIDIDQPTLNAEALTRLRQFELEHEEELLRLRHEDNKIDAEIEKAYLADLDSARKMQIAALQQDDKFAKRFLYWYAIAWTVASFGYIAGVTFLDIPPANQRVVDTILGFVLGTALASILAFFFGSSKGSKDKDAAMISLLAEKK